jgi:hypothetical protein
MDFFLLAVLAGLAFHFAKAHEQRRRIVLLGGVLSQYQIEKLMETLTEGYLRALGESDVGRREQIWQLLASAEISLSDQFGRFAQAFARLDAASTRVSRIPFALPWAERLLPGFCFDMRELFQIHARGLAQAALAASALSPRDKAYRLSAELFLMAQLPLVLQVPGGGLGSSAGAPPDLARPGAGRGGARDPAGLPGLCGRLIGPSPHESRMIETLPLPRTAWFWISHLGSAGLLLPPGLGTALGLWRAGQRPALLRWGVLFGLAVALTLGSKILFLGWGLGLASWDFTGVSGHSLLAAALYPVLLRVLSAGQPGLGRHLPLSLGLGLAAVAVARRARPPQPERGADRSRPGALVSLGRWRGCASCGRRRPGPGWPPDCCPCCCWPRCAARRACPRTSGAAPGSAPVGAERVQTREGLRLTGRPARAWPTE